MSDLIFIKLTPTDDVTNGELWLLFNSITGIESIEGEVGVRSGNRTYFVEETPDVIIDKMVKALNMSDGYGPDE